MIRYARTAAFAWAIAALPAAALADTIVIDSGTRIQTLSAADPLGQSFIATGNVLQSIGLQFATLNPGAIADSVTVSILNGAGFGGAVLGSVTASPMNVGRNDPKIFTDFTFSGLSLVNGGAYTIQVVNNGSGAGNGLLFGPNLNNPPFGSTFGPDAYAPGKMFFTGNVGGCGINPASCDLNFRVTTSNIASAVPEPATWAMMIGGFAMMGGALRRRRRAMFRTI